MSPLCLTGLTVHKPLTVEYRRKAVLRTLTENTRCSTNGQESPPSAALDYWGRLRRRSHSPRAERIKVKPPSPPSAQSTQTKKKPPGDLAISP